MDTNYRYRLSRLVRTQSSEIFLIWEEDRRIGQLDLHYAIESRTIHATLILKPICRSAPKKNCWRRLMTTLFLLICRRLSAKTFW